MRPDRVRLLQLLILCAVPPAIEAAVLRGVRFTSVLGLAPQASAVWPYGTFHDLRWMLVYHNSWVAFAVELLTATVARGLFCAVLIAIAWPPEVPRPSVRRLAGRNLAISAVATVLLSPWAAMALVTAQVSLSFWLAFELLPLLVLAPLLQRAGMVPGWWRGLPSAALVGWASLNFVVLTAAGALVWGAPSWLTVPVAALAGAANGLLWLRVVRAAVTQERVRWRRVPVTAVAFVLTLSLLAFHDDIATMGARPVDQSLLRAAPALPEFANLRYAVLFLGGYETSYDGQFAHEFASAPVTRFSYRGTEADGRPRPYRAQDTHQSVETSARLLAEQVDQLHARTGKPVALVGVSEGAMIIRYYLGRMPHPAVEAAALVSPLIRAGRIYYPPPEASSGWGVATGWQLRGIFALIGTTGRVPDHPDSPFVRSLMDQGPFFRNNIFCPVPGVQMVLFLPIADAATVPPGAYPELPVYEVTALHGVLLDRPAELRRLADFLRHGPTTTPETGWEYELIEQASGPWQAPALALRLNPAWHYTGQADFALRRGACAERG
ncbi:esterase/lipase family protein [Micromonospora purpureochromogenes]|uniref:esterase/lipase family protein n=1 Tax=Micromonospora purpureochromogenes TaxID=47872 RepID=UPI00363CA356